MEARMTTIVFEDTQGVQVLVTLFREGDRQNMTIAQRPERDATWGPPLLPVMVDGQKPEVNTTNPWSQDIPEGTNDGTSSDD